MLKSNWHPKIAQKRGSEQREWCDILRVKLYQNVCRNYACARDRCARWKKNAVQALSLLHNKLEWSNSKLYLIDHLIIFQSHHLYEHTYARDVVQAHNVSKPSLWTYLCKRCKFSCLIGILLLLAGPFSYKRSCDSMCIGRFKIRTSYFYNVATNQLHPQNKKQQPHNKPQQV